MSSDQPRRDLILAANAGSSSLKITLFTTLDPEVAKERGRSVEFVLNCSISSIMSPPVKAVFKSRSSFDDKANKKEQDPGLGQEGDGRDKVKDHETAFQWFLGCLKEVASIDKERIGWVCHRVVHGGDYHDPVVITEESYHDIEHLSDLAPLHNGAALSVIQACIKALPNAKSIAYFDTTFHRPIPPHIASYAIKQEVAEKRGLKKYGFHGLSYSYILRAVAKHLGKPPEELNLIALHLGSGASACAIKNGESLDTSMGLTPLSGLPGATRSGAIDPSLIFHYTNRAGRITHDPKSAAHVGVSLAEEILNKDSGWKAMTGTTDFATISSKAELSNPDPTISSRNPNRLAFDLFVDAILNCIGSYHLKLEGQVDALVFAGGIGERSVELREVVGRRVRCLGYQRLDGERNGSADGSVEVVQVSEEGSEISLGVEGEQRKKRILVCHTDEQFEMANDCASDTSRWEKQHSSTG
ncbi:acetate kinase [Coprinopsis cinerea okayama7|uniref:Probable acetate kinase n=1 Tax=Coprinopsis cinerea (strain Okayama-7 / 130 / ATCC MYA-4618 / FGSC 9003) TaxID=240176 RepID=A8NT51_COPC7|nr:acetate kinase [Coprinopsis cinerea okayama7\|eukprot:XP_001836158.2 acetate kinase [Coprinopsis cinerea okayama7\